MALQHTAPVLVGTLANAGPWAALYARAGKRVYPYQIGAIATANSTGITVTTDSTGDIIANDYVFRATKQSSGNSNFFTPSIATVRRVTARDQTTGLVTLDGALTINDGDYLFSLGTNDSGAYTPNFDDSRVLLYDSPSGLTLLGTRYLTTGDKGTYLGWLTRNTTGVALLISSGSNIPEGVVGFVPVHLLARESKGTATVLVGTQSITVAHGLGATPEAGDILISPINTWGGVSSWWVDTLNSTNFTIRTNTDVTGSNFSFAWRAKLT